MGSDDQVLCVDDSVDAGLLYCDCVADDMDSSVDCVEGMASKNDEKCSKGEHAQR